MNTAMATDAAPASRITFGGLRRFNLIMGCLHLAQGMLMLRAQHQLLPPGHDPVPEIRCHRRQTGPEPAGTLHPAHRAAGRRLPAAFGGGPFHPGLIRLQLVCGQPQAAHQQGTLVGILAELVDHDRADRHAGWRIRPFEPDPDLLHQRLHDLLWLHDGTAQPDNGEDQTGRRFISAVSRGSSPGS